jgi:hypothetical protein
VTILGGGGCCGQWQGGEGERGLWIGDRGLLSWQ